MTVPLPAENIIPMKRHLLRYADFRARKSSGFTLIELLVVVIIIGILATLAAPELLKQVEKGRQAEAKSALGAVNRSQQAYRLEHATFAVLSNLPIKISSGQYYNFENDTTSYATPDQLGSAQRARANSNYDNDIRNYASAVGQTTAGVYEAAICEASSPTNDSVTTTNASGDVACANGTRLQ